jgi:hypothetical protein
MKQILIRLDARETELLAERSRVSKVSRPAYLKALLLRDFEGLGAADLLTHRVDQRIDHIEDLLKRAIKDHIDIAKVTHDSVQRAAQKLLAGGTETADPDPTLTPDKTRPRKEQHTGAFAGDPKAHLFPKRPSTHS